MESGYINAVFLPEFGGRLWSLWDKKPNRELLYFNSSFRMATPAVRNAWFSGGNEHNMPELSNIVDFPYSSVGDCEKQWLDLMNNKTFDEFDISDEPKSYMVNSKWGSLIEKGAKTSNSWYAYLPLWSAAIFLFMYSVGRIFALICAKFKDMQNIVGIGLNICFWITPVFWRLAQNASFPVSIIKYTPVAVFVNGYRSVLLYGTFDIKALIYIICIDALIFIIGSPMQKRRISNIADGL